MSRLFDGLLNEYLNATSTPVTAAPFTLACLFFSTSLENQTLINVWLDGSDYFALHLDGKGGDAPFDGELDQITEAQDTQEVNTITSPRWVRDTWHHACGVWASSTSRTVYLDGANPSTGTTNLTPDAPDNIFIGRWGSAALGMDGSIAEVAIWNAVLSAAEVAILAKGFSPLFVRPQSLVFYSPLIRGLDDRVGGLTLTASGTVVSAHPAIIYPAPPMVLVAPAAAGGNPWYAYAQQ